MVDENEAPEGFRAVEDEDISCVGCYFFNNPNKKIKCSSKKGAYSLSVSCMRDSRKDKTFVKFVKKNKEPGLQCKK